MKQTTVKKPNEVSMSRSLFELKANPISGPSMSKPKRGKRLERRKTTKDLRYGCVLLTYTEPDYRGPDPYFERALGELNRLKLNSIRMRSKDLDCKLDGHLTERLNRETFDHTKSDPYSEYSQSYMNVPAPRSDSLIRRLSRCRKPTRKLSRILSENLRDVSPILARTDKLPILRTRLYHKHAST